MGGGLERVRCGGGGKEDFCVVGLRGYVTCACMINDDEAALVAPSPDVEGKTDMVCVDLKTSFESHNLAVTQEFLGLSFTVEEVFHSKKHKVIVATWGCNTRGDCVWSLRSLQQQPPHHPVLLHTSEVVSQLYIMLRRQHRKESDAVSEWQELAVTASAPLLSELVASSFSS
ncbi:hypothetical protein Pelo_17539 [Pelomyxa schiedti]|nr:hypothetical protein Pelo_17539 [Pelomyxa schiedti]